ncbi:hypothetical protein MACK_002624 [Theileria orientalis]|uniref:Uncharacterized protein n=1 Tax=Theileria orientalis TaxID=68886 RepID=A0A976MDV4_THEOR|nr:hypothetical protein MACK_002624 [Theileria orientalis]
MFLNIVKNDVKYLFSQKRYNLEAISNRCEYNDVIPFSFNEIDKIVKKRSKSPEKSIHIDKLHKKIFYKFIRQTNSLIYANVSLAKPLRNNTTETASSDNLNDQRGSEEEIVCNQIERILGSLDKDNLIIVLQRSLSAHYYSKSKCWYSLSTRTLRYCFLNEQKLGCDDLVKILASLSKWRFHNLSEFGNKLDFYILLNHEWDTYQASQILWSLCHLNLFTLKAFDYLNGIIIGKLSSSIQNNALSLHCNVTESLSNKVATCNTGHIEQDFALNDDFYKNIHRIASANLTRSSKTGMNSPVLSSIHDYLSKNLVILKCLDTKTMLSVTGLFPHGMYNDKLTTSVLEILVNSFQSYTQAQAVQILYNLAVVHSDLSLRAKDLVIKLLYKFRVLVLSSECTFIPSAVCKLLYTSRVFLNNFDSNFVSKCLSDLNANLHLIGQFSLVGNVLCLNQLVNEFGSKLDSRQKENIDNTMNNLIKFDDNGNFSKLVDGSLVPLENVKLWHLSAINNSNSKQYKDGTLGLESIFSIYNAKRMNDSFNEFYETCKGENYMSSMKNLVLFISLLKVFKREVAFGNTRILSVSNALIKILTNIFKEDLSEKENECESAVNYLEETQGDRVLENDEIVIIKFWELIRLFRGEASVCNISGCKSTNTDEMAKELFHSFYSHTGSNSSYSRIANTTECSAVNSYTSEDETSKGDEVDVKESKEAHRGQQYMNKCLKSSCRPIQVDLLYTKLFFLQDHPKYFISLVPSIIIGEALNTRAHDLDIFKIAELLEREKQWNFLSRYLDANRGSVGHQPSTSYEEKTEKLADARVQLRGFYSNWKVSEMEIDYILENQYIGAWLCPYVLKNASNQTILIFQLKSKEENNLHIFDVLRRDVLTKFGYNFIELCYW